MLCLDTELAYSHIHEYSGLYMPDGSIKYYDKGDSDKDIKRKKRNRLTCSKNMEN